MSEPHGRSRASECNDDFVLTGTGAQVITMPGCSGVWLTAL